jgi:hypothetical protein
MKNVQFPEQKLIAGNRPLSRGELESLLAQITSAAPSFTGYLRFSGESDCYFLFFLKGAPYAAGRYSGAMPVSYTITELGTHLATLDPSTVNVSLCQTDPVLLKSMLLFLQEEPTVKAPANLVDLEQLLRSIAEAGKNALVTLCRNKMCNFYFFREGKGAVVYYADHGFTRPEGMTVDEELLLYAFQPEGEVEAYIFRNMETFEAEDAYKLDHAALLKLLTSGR